MRFNSFWFVRRASLVQLPVCGQSGGDVASRNLSHDVAPEEGAVNHPHSLRVPVEFRFLKKNKIKQNKKSLSTAFTCLFFDLSRHLIYSGDNLRSISSFRR